MATGKKKPEEAEIIEGEMPAQEEAAHEMSLEEVQAVIAKMLDEAKAEAKKIVEEAKNTGAPARGGVAYKPAISEERVTVRLFKDRGQYSGDKFVGVNGVGYQIKRGVDVEVPKSVAEILAQSEEQDASTALMVEEKTLEYEKTKG